MRSPNKAVHPSGGSGGALARPSRSPTTRGGWGPVRMVRGDVSRPRIFAECCLSRTLGGLTPTALDPATAAGSGLECKMVRHVTTAGSDARAVWDDELCRGSISCVN